jgi:hypothetical protein
VYLCTVIKDLEENNRLYSKDPVEEEPAGAK